MKLVVSLVLGVATSPKDDGGRKDDAKSAAAFADVAATVGREGPLFLTDDGCGGSVAAVIDAVASVEGRGLWVLDLSARYAVASLSVMEMPPMMMFKVSSGAGALLKG